MTNFYNWQSSSLDWDAPPYESCSPNLVELGKLLEYLYPVGFSLGCHGDRPIRQGSRPSSHSYGAATDWGQTNQTGESLNKILKFLDEICDFLIATSKQTGIQAIHHYYRDKIWRCNRDPAVYPDGWKIQNGAGGGMGEAWASYIHVEVNLEHHQRIPNWGNIFTQYVNGMENEVVSLADAKIESKHPYRLWDSRQGRNHPYPANERVTVNLGDPNLKVAFINVTPVGTTAGHVSIKNAKTSLANFTTGTPANPNSCPVALNNGTFEVIIGPVPCHFIVDVYAEG